MSAGERVAAAALALVGTRYRLHGRDPATGLDCVGVVAAALAGAGYRGDVPTGYALRSGDAARAGRALDAALVRVERVESGSAVLMQPGLGQLHLGVWTGQALVHADAGLRRVVARPGALPWPVLGAWATGED